MDDGGDDDDDDSERAKHFVSIAKYDAKRPRTSSSQLGGTTTAQQDARATQSDGLSEGSASISPTVSRPNERPRLYRRPLGAPRQERKGSVLREAFGKCPAGWPVVMMLVVGVREDCEKIQPSHRAYVGPVTSLGGRRGSLTACRYVGGLLP